MATMISTTEQVKQCLICNGAAADAEFERTLVWEDELWRLTVSLAAEVSGFSYLEPKRHVPHITDLDGREAATLGSVLARCANALKDTTGADVVYIYVFGDGVPHLHVHLAPHRKGDALNDQMIRGEFVEEKLPSGVTRYLSEKFPPLNRDHLIDVAQRVRQKLNPGPK